MLLQLLTRVLPLLVSIASFCGTCTMVPALAQNSASTVESELRRIAERPKNKWELREGSRPTVETEDLTRMLAMDESDLCTALTVSLQSDDKAIRLTACEVMNGFARNHPDKMASAVPELARLLQSQDQTVMFSARMILIELGPTASPVAWEVLNSLPEDKRLTGGYQSTIRGWGPKPLEVYRKHLNPEVPGECILALVALQALQDQARAAAPQVEKLISHQNERVQSQALVTLASIAEPEEAAETLLRETVNPVRPLNVRTTALATYERLRRPDTVDQCLRLLEKNCPNEIRRMIAATLAMSYTTHDYPQRAIGSLTELLDDEDPEVVANAIDSLGSWEAASIATAPRILHIMQQPSQCDYFPVGSKALGRMGYADPRFLSLLEKNLDGPSQRETMDALSKLGRAGESVATQVFEVIEATTNHDDLSLSKRIRPMTTLIAISSNAPDQLLPFLEHEDSRVRISTRIAMKNVAVADIPNLLPKLRRLEKETENLHATSNLRHLIQILERKLVRQGNSSTDRP